MRQYHYEVTVATPSTKLYQAITDLQGWPKWDPEIERIEHAGSLAPGSSFALKPRGGPKVTLTIEAAQPSSLFADVTHFPLARMRTRHEFEPTGDGTRIRIRIEVWGPLGFLWDRIVARKQAAGVAAQTEAFVRYAEAQS